MTISLGGAEGPRDGGLTTIGGRPIQAACDRDAKDDRAGASAGGEGAGDGRADQERAEEGRSEGRCAKDPQSRTPTKGAEIEQGSAVAETAGRGQGFGLSSGGGFGDRRLPRRREFLLSRVPGDDARSHQAELGLRQQGAGHDRDQIHHPARRTHHRHRQSSNRAAIPALDFMAQRALALTRQLPPLPAAFTEPSLTVHLFSITH